MKISIIAMTVGTGGESMPVVAVFETDIKWLPMDSSKRPRDPLGVPSSIVEITLTDDDGNGIRQHVSKPFA